MTDQHIIWLWISTAIAFTCMCALAWFALTHHNKITDGWKLILLMISIGQVIPAMFYVSEIALHEKEKEIEQDFQADERGDLYVEHRGPGGVQSGQVYILRERVRDPACRAFLTKRP